MQFYYLINDLGIFGSSYTNNKHPVVPIDAASEPKLANKDPNSFILISFPNIIYGYKLTINFIVLIIIIRNSK